MHRPTTQQHDELWDTCRDLARSKNVLAEFTKAIGAAGVAGEERLTQLLFLVLTSASLPELVSAVLTGPPASGKSYVLRRTLQFFPAERYLDLTGTSPKAFFYDDQPIAHRHIVVREWAAIKGQKFLEYIARTVVSEPDLRYSTTVRSSTGKIEAVTIVKSGPAGFLTTSVDTELHFENATRLLFIPADASREQTRRVLRKQAQERRRAVDLRPWHALQTWITLGEPDVTIPYGDALAEAIADDPLRVRRDHPAIRSLLVAHTLLHRASRQRDANGCIVATMDDYRAVHGLGHDILAHREDDQVDTIMHETVDAVRQIVLETGQPTTGEAVGRRLGINKSSASRRIAPALKACLLENLGRRGQPQQLVVTALAAKRPLMLPTPEELAERLRGRGGCTSPERQHRDDGLVACADTDAVQRTDAPGGEPIANSIHEGRE